MITRSTLRELRLRTGRTQAEVAARVGIPASVLSAYERGRRQPGLDVAARVIAELGYRVQFVPALDPSVQAERLVEVLRLAEALPYRPRPMAGPRWGASRGPAWPSTTVTNRSAQPRRPRPPAPV